MYEFQEELLCSN